MTEQNLSANGGYDEIRSSSSGPGRPCAKRPGMYIGDTSDGTGLHHMVFEVVDNAIDEALAGTATTSSVTIHADNSISVTDNGRGIPVGIRDGRQSRAQALRRRNRQPTPAASSTRTPTRSPAVCTASARVRQRAVEMAAPHHPPRRQSTSGIHRIRRNRVIERRTAPLVSPLKVIGDTRTAAPRCTSAPTRKSSAPSIPLRHPRQRLRELSFLNNGVKINPGRPAHRQGRSSFSGGVKGFVEYINRSKTGAHPDRVPLQRRIGPRTASTITVEVAMQWNDSYQEQVLCFTNNIPQADGGTHLTGLRAAMTR